MAFQYRYDGAKRRQNRTVQLPVAVHLTFG